MTRTDADGALDEALALVSRAPSPGAAGGHRAAPWPRARETAARAAGVRGRTHRVALADALGEVLAAPLDALGDLPSFDTSAMDGWAVAGPGPWSIRPGGGILKPAPSRPRPSPTARPYGSPPAPGSPPTPAPSSAASTPASPAASCTPPGPSAPARTSARAARNAAPATCCSR